MRTRQDTLDRVGILSAALVALALLGPVGAWAGFLGCNLPAGTFGPCDYEVDIGGGNTRVVKYWRNHRLSVTNYNITRVVIVVHGTIGGTPQIAHNDVAETQHTRMRNAALSEGVESNTVIIAPFFPKNANANQCPAAPSSTHCNGTDCLCWNSSTPQNRSWKFGGVAANGNDLLSTSSFAVVDAIVEHVANSGHFPNVTTIVIAGHSAGGQFTQRYATANQAGVPGGIRMRYVPCNPGSYMFLNPLRPTRNTIDNFPDYTAGLADIHAWRHADYDFAQPAPECPDRWPPNYDRHNDYIWGLDRLDGVAPDSRYHMHYFHRLSLAGSGSIAELVQRQFLEREIVLLHGENDSAYEVGGDFSECPHKAQGTNRLMRGGIVFNQACESYDCGNLGFAVVEDADHSSNQMYNSQYGRKVIFQDLKPPSIGLQHPISTPRDRAVEITLADLGHGYSAGSKIYTPTGSRTNYEALREADTGALSITPNVGYVGVLWVPVHVEVPVPDDGFGAPPRNDKPNQVVVSNIFRLHVNVGMNWLHSAVNNPALF